MLHYGPARVPSRDSPEEAIDLLQERGFTACEIDFEGKFWMDYPWAERVRELGTADDVFAISKRAGWVRPVLDFAHLHAVTDGAFTETKRFVEILAGADAVLPPGAPFHIHFSDIAFANRNETKHLPYGEGTLRADPLRKALRRFKRPATVISESPDLKSTQAIFAALSASASSRSRRSSSPAASSSRPRSR